MGMNTCRLCGYTWFSYKVLPSACAKCKRYDWKEKVSSSQIKRQEVLKNNNPENKPNVTIQSRFKR